MIVAKQNESAELVRNLAKRFLAIRFEQESTQSPIWRWLGVNDFDNLIFDRLFSRYIYYKKNFRCNRLAKIINHSEHQPDFQETFLALKASTNFENCGLCQYDSGSINETYQIALNNKIPTLKVYPEVRIITNSNYKILEYQN